MTTKTSDFVRERDHALLSMDKQTIVDYVQKYGVAGILSVQNDDDMFWLIVHKARTGATSLPIKERRKSKKWLSAFGLQSMDDGKL